MNRSGLIYSVCTGSVLGFLALMALPPLHADQLLGGHMLSVHLLMELFAVVIAFMIVMVSFHSLANERKDESAKILLAGFLIVALSDILHALTYKGMPAFLAESSTPRAIFFWLAGRTAEAATVCMVAFGVAWRVGRGTAVFTGLAVALAVAWVGSFHIDAVPATFVEGSGVTPFKRNYEVVLCGLNLLAAAVLLRRGKATGDRRLDMLGLSCFVMGVGELSFTAYVAPSDIQNIVGHVYKLVAYGLLYVATFVAAIRAPHDDLKRTTAKLEESTQQLRALGENLPNAAVFMLVCDADGSRPSFTYYSPSIAKIVGVSATAIQANPEVMLSRFMPEDFELVAAGRRRAALSMLPAECTARLQAASGQTRHVLIKWAPRPGAGGKVILDGMLIDVTDRVASEQSRRVLESQLQLSQKMEALGTLASGISHDFNNVLGAIVGNVALAKHAGASGNAHGLQASLEQIQKSASRARNLVRQILAFSRQQPVQRATLPVLPLLEETVQMLRAAIPPQVDLQVRRTSPGLHVSADATQMQQVLMNLCMNAWQAMSEAAGNISLEAKLVEVSGEMAAMNQIVPGPYVEMAVTDTGMGMSPEIQRRVFEPFFTTKPVGVGTGLGLPVVHGIVRAHDGAILLESAVGVGSTFRVLLPQAQPAAVGPDEAVAPVALRPPAPATPSAGLRVLYIDDDEVMGLMIEGLLGLQGFAVIAMQNPDEALELLRQGRDSAAPIDVLVTDFNMPRQTGLDVVARVREIRPELPCILSTGDMSPELLVRAQEVGVAGFVEKQNSFEDLAPAILRAVAPAP